MRTAKDKQLIEFTFKQVKHRLNLDSKQTPVLSIEQILSVFPISFQFLPLLRDWIHTEDFEIENTVQLLKKDPLLAANIIKTSNSGHYPVADKCENLHNAIVRIGLLDCYILTANHSMKRLASAFKSNEASERLIQQSTQTASWSEHITNFMADCGLKTHTNSHSAYLSGLLHNIGQMLITLLFENRGLEVDWLGNFESELQRLGTTSAAISGSILIHWNFHQNICHPILFQNQQPESLGPSCCILNLGVQLMQSQKKEESIKLLYFRNKTVLNKLHIDCKMLHEIVDTYKMVP